MIKTVEISSDSLFVKLLNNFISKTEKNLFFLDISPVKNSYVLLKDDLKIKEGDASAGFEIAKIIIDSITHKKDLKRDEMFSVHADVIIDSVRYYLFIQGMHDGLSQSNYQVSFRLKPVNAISKDIIGLTRIDDLNPIQNR